MTTQAEDSALDQWAAGQQVDDQRSAEDSAASITMYEDGPLLVRGSFQIYDQDGAAVDAGRQTVALCRCGRSALKPFCDGSHKLSGFRAPGRHSRTMSDE